MTQVSSLDPLDMEFDWTIWVGYRPGVRDNPGSTAVEAVEDILGIRFGPGSSHLHFKAVLPERVKA